MNITLSNTKEMTAALENYRASEIDKLYKMQLQLQVASKGFEFINISCALETQISILEQATNEQLAQMYLQKNLLDEYETFTNDPQFILGTNVEATLLIYEKGSNERVQPTYYNTIKQLHDDLIHTVDAHYSNFTESQYTVYEAALNGIELALQSIEVLPLEYDGKFGFESTTHKYEVSFFKHF